MPIYEYRCKSCGHEQDVLQKMSDPPLLNCPACGEATMQKQVTAAGFQLKGSGWYATDFKGGAKPAAKADDSKAENTASEGSKAKSDPSEKSDKSDKAEIKPSKPESKTKEDSASKPAPSAGATPV